MQLYATICNYTQLYPLSKPRWSKIAPHEVAFEAAEPKVKDASDKKPAAQEAPEIQYDDKKFEKDWHKELKHGA